MTLLIVLVVIPGLAAGPPSTVEPSELQTPRGVFLAALTRLESVNGTDRTAELARFLASAHRVLLRESSDRDRLREKRRVLLLGLGALFDPGDLLLGHPLSRSHFEGIVRPEEKIRRLQICESVLFEDRSDAAKHFFISAALTAVAGPFLGDRIGRNKEFRDARRDPAPGQGFSFVDLAYDHAGIRYAVWLLGEKDPGRLEALPPPLERFIPPFTALGLPEGLDWATFRKRYQGKNSHAYWKVIRRIHSHLDAALENPSETPKKKR